jgi:cytochrome c556
MKITHRIGYITLGLAAALAACRGSSAAPAKQDPPAPAAKSAPAANNMDSRTPLPLTAMMATHQKQEMRDHLRVVQEITAALTKDDFDAITKSAARIGWSEQQAMMCKHMGAGAPGFAEVGEHFHKTADTIAEAAKRHDHAGVTAALDATLRTCVGCHESYRQEIVDAATFEKAGGAAGGGMDANCPMMHSK